uniref:hypothetical protein n=1 Tax=Ohtaekwangia sp. TaxID=2066019 RepID=UPI002FDE549D
IKEDLLCRLAAQRVFNFIKSFPEVFASESFGKKILTVRLQVCKKYKTQLRTAWHNRANSQSEKMNNYCAL